MDKKEISFIEIFLIYEFSNDFDAQSERKNILIHKIDVWLSIIIYYWKFYVLFEHLVQAFLMFQLPNPFQL